MFYYFCCYILRLFCKVNKKFDIFVEIFIFSELVFSLNRICFLFCFINWLDSLWFFFIISFFVVGFYNL